MTNDVTIEVFKSLMCESELHSVISQNVKRTDYAILKSTLNSASDDLLLGFLADHLKAQIDIQLEGGEKRSIHLFIKSMPLNNVAKADFINELGVFKKESTLFNGPMKEFGGSEEPYLWRPLVYLATNKIIVMRDHSYDGFVQIDKMKYMNYDYCAVTLDSIAMLHSESINFEFKRNIATQIKYKIIDEYVMIATPTSYNDSPWLRAGVKSVLKFLGVLSAKYNYEYEHFNKIEEQLLYTVVEACDLRIDDDQINVVLHRDLWSNNILFRHSTDGKPENAMLIDYQCIEYGPAALDVMAFFYLNTEKEFRRIHEGSLLKRYYETFISNVQDKSFNKKTHALETFLKHAEICRKFGMVVAILLFPYILMDPKTAKLVFDDPSNFKYYSLEDRSEPMVSYAKENIIYKNRILDLVEEFIDKYVL